MKKIISGKSYDTEKATFLAEDSFEYPGNFRYWKECLYQKKTGEFFLYGYGGPMTKYAKSIGQNEWASGEKISPLSYEAAQSWAEDHLDGDEYEKIFGEIEENDEKVFVNWTISASSAEKIKREAAKRGMTISNFLDELISNL